MQKQGGEIFRGRAKSVLPPINSNQERQSVLERRKGSAQYGVSPVNNATPGPGKLIKLDQLDIQSETRSVYKLDPNATIEPTNKYGNLVAARSNNPSGYLERAFARLDIADRA